MRLDRPGEKSKRREISRLGEERAWSQDGCRSDRALGSTRALGSGQRASRHRDDLDILEHLIKLAALRSKTNSVNALYMISEVN